MATENDDFIISDEIRELDLATAKQRSRPRTTVLTCYTQKKQQIVFYRCIGRCTSIACRSGHLHTLGCGHLNPTDVRNRITIGTLTGRKIETNRRKIPDNPKYKAEQPRHHSRTVYTAEKDADTESTTKSPAIAQLCFRIPPPDRKSGLEEKSNQT